MKKFFLALLLASVASLAMGACHSKKPAASSPTDKAEERKDDATGGARYGGRAPSPSKAPEPAPH
jgi:hypothetical protein